MNGTVTSVIVSLIRRFVAQTFLLIPVVSIFAIFSIFLQEKFDTSFFVLFGLTDIYTIFADSDGKMDENQLFTLLLVFWLAFTIITTLVENVFKFKVKINFKRSSRIIHGLTFILLSWMMIGDGNAVITSLLVTTILMLFSYGSSIIYLTLSQTLAGFNTTKIQTQGTVK